MTDLFKVLGVLFIVLVIIAAILEWAMWIPFVLIGIVLLYVIIRMR